LRGGNIDVFTAIFDINCPIVRQQTPVIRSSHSRLKELLQF